MTLTVTDLAVARSGAVLLEGISFTLSSGTGLVLHGPNGIGKTTLLRTVAGLQPAQEGLIDCAEDSLVYSGHADGHKAMLSVRENLQFWSSVFQGPPIEEALKAFDLLDLQNRLAGALSAGQKRRLALARLVVTGRRVWILDEPTVSLDARSVDLFGDAVHAHLGQGGSVLMSTHIDLGLRGIDELDLTGLRAKPRARDIDEAFL